MKKLLALALSLAMIVTLFAAVGTVSVSADSFYTAGVVCDMNTAAITAPGDATQGNINLKTMYVAAAGEDLQNFYNCDGYITATLTNDAAGNWIGVKQGEGVRIQLNHPLSATEFPSFSMRLMFNCGGTFYAFNRNTTNFCPRNAAQDFTLGGNFEVITFDSARFADDDGYVRGIIFQLKSEQYVAQFFADNLIPLATHYTPAPVTPIDANIYGGVIGGNAGGFNIRFDDRDAFSNVATGSVYRPTNCIYVNGTLVSNVTATVNADKTLHIAYNANEGDVLSIDGQIGMEYVGPISFQYKNGEWFTVLGGDASEPFIFETLLNNPSFTSGTTRWQIYGKPSSCTDTMQSTDDGYNGKGMLIIHKGSAAGYSVRTSSNITVVPGATYQIRAKVKVSGNVKLGCSLYSNTTAAVCDKVENTTIIKNGNTEFEQVNYRLTVPAGTTSVKLQLEQSFASSMADVVYDEVAMYRVFPGGDINGDECVDVRDLVHFKKYFADVENVALSSLNAADVNRNGVVNVIDTVALKQIILRREDPSGIDPKVIINAPSGIVYPYADICKDFITTPGAQVKYYYANIGEAAKPIMIEWETASESYTSFTVEYGTKPDYSDAVTVTTNEKSLGLYNLYKDTAYNARVTAHGTNGNDFTDETTFRTTDQGPRVMKIDGIYNVRDLGGYTTPNGTTLQGKIFRGSEMNGSHNIALTPAGDDYMSNVLGIKTDLDLRNPADSGYTYVSPISSANLQYVSIAAYDSAFKQTDLYRQIFSMMSYESNYPFYVHCWGGADRTGTVCFLVNALLGVDGETLVKDYEFTSYAIFGMRDSTGTEYNFSGFLEELKTYPGATLAEKTENYMLSIGVTADEIYNIRAIMYGQPTRVSVKAPATFDGDNDDAYVISVNGGATVSNVSIGGVSVNFIATAGGVSVAKADLPEMTDGDVLNGVLTLDSGATYPFTFKYVTKAVLELTDYMFSESGSVRLDSQVTTLQSDRAVGYGKTVRMHLKSLTGTNGNLQVFIGSYGICLRGGSFRIWALGQNGAYTEIGRANQSMNAASELFDNGGDLLLRVDCDNTGVTLSWSVEINGVSKCTYSYTVGSVAETGFHGRRITDEISSENAKVTFKIDGQSAGTPELVVTTGIKGNEPVEKDYVELRDYLTSETGTVVLDSNHKTVSSNAPIGYNQKVRIDLQSTTVANGRLCVMIGSYGVLMRGGAFRIVHRNADGSYSESSSNYSINCPHNYFDTADRYLMMEVAIVGDDIVIRASACNSAGVEEWTCNYMLGTFSDDTGRVANEIRSDEAYLTVVIDGADSGTKSLKLFTRDGGEEPKQPEEPTDPVDETVHALSEYVNFGGNNIVLNSANKKLTSDTACGYNKTVRVDLQTVTGANGNLWVMIGSYGVRLRGGSFRIAYLNAYDRYDELTRVGETLNCPTQIFDDGAHYLLMRVDESAAGVTVHVQVCNVNGTVEVAHSYKIGSYQGSVMPDGGRIAGEISSENAHLTIIADDSSLGTTSATVKPN